MAQILIPEIRTLISQNNFLDQQPYSVVCILKSMKQADVAPTINSEHQMLCINHVKSVVAKCLFLKIFCSMNERGSIFDD